MHFNFDNSYLSLPEPFFAPVKPTFVSNPQIIIVNETLTKELELDLDAGSPDCPRFFSGNQLLSGSQPIAQAYCGHQFGYFTMLGDGRAILLGEHVTSRGERLDIQLKGAGVTPFSRNGDGRAALGPMLREYIISEGMHHLGIPTTRSLAVVTTGENIYRDRGKTHGAILTRVAQNHIRVGTFEFAARLGEASFLQNLADYAIKRHFPHCLNSPSPYENFLRAVIEKQASLIAKWMQVGFIHGVMNTDNMAISGETIDYGPCAFLDNYDAAMVFSSIDVQGRYAFANQPKMAHWNLARFAETLLPILAKDPNESLTIAQSVLGEFPAIFECYWLKAMQAKLGILNEEKSDRQLVEDFFSLLQKYHADYTITFRNLAALSTELPIFHQDDFKAWRIRWQSRLSRQPNPIEIAYREMNLHNPAIIPRNHRVEEVLAAAEKSDFEPLHTLLHCLKTPYEDKEECEQFKQAPRPDEIVEKTFCGT